MTISPSDRLQVGQQYTFLFDATDFNPFVQPKDLTADLVNNVGYIDNVFVNQGVGPYYVQLTYTGDGTDTVDGLAYDMEQAVNNNHTLWSWKFSSASAGPTNPGTVTKKDIANVLPDTSTLVIIVVGIALVVFAMSGGPGIVRGLSEGARS